MRHITATDYFSACEEAGCEWEGNFKSIPETFISRIDSDPIRSEEEKKQQKCNVPWQMQYLEKEYFNVVRINTEDRSLDEVVDEIIALLLNNS